ncbi:MAG: lytic transglycosylase domain-containing protein [Flavobacteriales bacterium]
MAHIKPPNKAYTFMKKQLFISLLSFVIISGSMLFFINSKTSETNDNERMHQFQDNYKIFSIKKPKTVSFAGEQINLNDPDIYEKFDRELHVNTYWQSNTILLIKRSKKYFPIIEPILKKHGVPDDFKYLAVAESGLQNVTSPAGAKGFWQFMKSAAKEHKLEVSKTVDERYHLEKATEAACKYLLKSKADLGNADWLTVAASYNMGITGIKRQQARQKSKHYLDLLLNSETARYIYRISALKLILEQPKEYGFFVNPDDLYKLVPTNIVVVDSTIDNLADFAHIYGINYKQLKVHNPWLREAFLTDVSRKKYEIKIPDTSFYTFEHN